MVVVARHQRGFPVGIENHRTRAGFLAPNRHLAGGSYRRAADVENGDGSFLAVGDQSQGAGSVDRHAGSPLARLQGGENFWRTRCTLANANHRFDPRHEGWLHGCKLDHREFVVGAGLVGIGGVNALVGGDERDIFAWRYGHVERRADDTVGNIDFRQNPGRIGPQVDDRHGIGWRILLDHHLAIDQLHLVIVGRHRDLGRRWAGCSHRHCHGN